MGRGAKYSPLFKPCTEPRLTAIASQNNQNLE
jgi:hypothetical protein